MIGTVNKVILIGNLGKDPEIRNLENGSKVANFTLATSEVYLDKSNGEKKVVTDWHDVVAWRGLAEITEKYLKKGYKVYVEGKLKKRVWQDKEGNNRYTTEIIVTEMTILSRPDSIEKQADQYTRYSDEGTPNQPPPLDSFLYESHDDLPF